MPAASSFAVRLRVAVAALIAAVAAAIAGAPAASAAPTDTVVVRGAEGTDRGDVRSALRRAGLTEAAPLTGGLVSARARAGRSAPAAVARLRRSGAIGWAAESPRARIALAGTPNDSGTLATSPAGGWQFAQWDLVGPFGVNVAPAWQAARAAGAEGGAGVTVAVLDSGLAYANRGRFRRSPDVSATRVRPGYDFVDRDRYPDDANGHGTLVASTIAAATGNGVGMTGIAYRARIMPVRVLDARGNGSAARVAEGMLYAIRRGAQVLNVSIELVDRYERPLSFTVAPEIRAALREARRRGVLVVAATGNLASTTVPSRALAGDVLYVGGTTERGCIGDYSNRGPGLDLVAPGGGPDDVIADPQCRPEERAGRNVSQVTFARPRVPGRFSVSSAYDGTSMAAPHVAGAAALVIAAGGPARRPSPAAVSRLLTSTARDLWLPGRDAVYGAGLLDAGAAMAARAVQLGRR